MKEVARPACGHATWFRAVSAEPVRGDAALEACIATKLVAAVRTASVTSNIFLAKPGVCEASTCCAKSRSKARDLSSVRSASGLDS